MGKINSKSKGKRGELFVVKKFKDRGYQCNRTVQFKGNTGRADDIEGIDYIHAEVKFVERLNLEEAMAQALHDKIASGKDVFATIFHKKNNKPLMVTMLFDDWCTLYDSYYSDMKLKEREERYEMVEKAKEENGICNDICKDN